jgi:uncharacterized protein (UPF0147 family)
VGEKKANVKKEAMTLIWNLSSQLETIPVDE